ncbi:hypothetical protein FS837_010228 [Tulasnella sp. UAMH 9824]|nr:hypothetical protein FS837_010228 [Tulasnella sp. UAMH 9824]
MESLERRQQLKLMSLEELGSMLPQKLGTYHSTNPDQDKTVPFLQALFEFAPTATGQHNVAVDVLACATNECLEKLAKRYLYELVLPIRAAAGTTPPVSDHPSRPPADVDASSDRSTMWDLALEAGQTERQPGESATTVDNACILPCSLMPSGEEESVGRLAK